MNRLKKEEGFTLIEMLIVLLVISVLMLIAIPNVTKHSKSIDEKGCAAYVVMIQGQVEAYKMDKGGYPAKLGDLVTEDYLPQGTSSESLECPDGTALTFAGGKVTTTGSGG